MIDLCFFGDSVSFGMGDETGGGWVQRLIAREAGHRDRFRAFPLSVPGEQVSDLSGRIRWEAECRMDLRPERSGLDGAIGLGSIRMTKPQSRGAIILQIGHGDLVESELEGLGANLPNALTSAERLIREIQDLWPVLWIGPTIPAREAGVVAWPRQVSRPAFRGKVRADCVKALNRAYAGLAARMDVDYLDLASVLAADPRWDPALYLGDGIHPGGDGHQAIAEAVAAWVPWRTLIDGHPPAQDGPKNQFTPLKAVGAALG